jgi:hypothetical protein
VAGISTQHQPVFPLQAKPSCGMAVNKFDNWDITDEGSFDFYEQADLEEVEALQVKLKKAAEEATDLLSKIIDEKKSVMTIR